MGFLPNREICAASRYTRRVDAYIHYYRGRRKKPKANRKCPFCPKFRRVKLAKRVKDKEIKYGKTDSCAGDSGGPLWKWMGKDNPKANSPSFKLSRTSNSNNLDPQLTSFNHSMEFIFFLLKRITKGQFYIKKNIGGLAVVCWIMLFILSWERNNCLQKSKFTKWSNVFVLSHIVNLPSKLEIKDM